MSRIPAFAFGLLLAASWLREAPATQPADFWYVVPSELAAAGATHDLVRGIVIPSQASPTVQTSPSGSVLSWERADGTRQSFAVAGVSSFAFKPGPLAGTTYVPFGRARRLQWLPPDDSCCSCASWENSEESISALSCVIGCAGCGCEGCICSPTYPCPDGPGSALVLKPNRGSSPTLAFSKSGSTAIIGVSAHGRSVAGFRGHRLDATVAANGEPAIENPDAITLQGRTERRAMARADKALFAWSSPDAGVIVEQPLDMATPSFRDGVIDLGGRRAGAQTNAAPRPHMAPVMDRCSVCGTHPNSTADLNLMECVPGESVCYRCISWQCFTPES